ncbi:MAG: hydroxyacid dehydrogenase [Spartobacteria bacterium]
MTSLNALLIGMPNYLPKAYPEALRAEIGKKVRLLPETASGIEWKNHTAALAEADVIFATWGMPKLDEEFLTAAPRLKAVFYAAGSVKGFATPESYKRGILISSAWQANAIPVAEYSHATILLGLTGFWSSQRLAKAGKFRHQHFPVAGGFHSTVGLVSLGAIGRLVAGHLAKHEINIVAYDPYSSPAAAAKLGVTLVSLEELFAKSHVVSIHTPWLPETEKMINAPLLRSMPEAATLINTSRGAVIDETDLCQVLAERQDITAILDVTHPEPPLPDSPLRTLENVVLTPHIAGSIGGEIARMGYWMNDELELYLAGKPLRHSVSEDMLARMA